MLHTIEGIHKSDVSSYRRDTNMATGTRELTERKFEVQQLF